MSTSSSACFDGRAPGGVPAGDAVFSITITEGGAPPAQDVKQGLQAAPDAAYTEGAAADDNDQLSHDGGGTYAPQPCEGATCPNGDGRVHPDGVTHGPAQGCEGATCHMGEGKVRSDAYGGSTTLLSRRRSSAATGLPYKGGVTHGPAQSCEGATCPNGDGRVGLDGGSAAPLPRRRSSLVMAVLHKDGDPPCEGATCPNGDGQVDPDGGSTIPLSRHRSSAAMAVPYQGATHGPAHGCEGATCPNGDGRVDPDGGSAAPLPRRRSGLSTGVPPKGEGGDTGGAKAKPQCEGASCKNGDRNPDLYRGPTRPRARARSSGGAHARGRAGWGAQTRTARDDGDGDGGGGDMRIMCEGASCKLPDAVMKIMAVDAFEHPPARPVAGGAGGHRADVDPAYDGSVAGELRFCLVGE